METLGSNGERLRRHQRVSLACNTISLGHWLTCCSKGLKVRVKAHNGTISIQGVTVADLDENMKVVHLETWFEYVGSQCSMPEDY
jgi:hypothetical protein